MAIKDIMRPIPGTRQISLARQRLRFGGSASYWEQNYANGGTSGDGSYGLAAHAKADFLNKLVRQNGIDSVVEFGCGDGHQLSLAEYPRYIGLDVSPSAVQLCKRRFIAAAEKSFFRYDGTCFIDRAHIFSADLALSLDVIYHLVEDSVFRAYMTHLFAAARSHVVVYSTDAPQGGTAPHVRHRNFSQWVAENCPQWQLTERKRGPNSGAGRADFFVYETLGG